MHIYIESLWLAPFFVGIGVGISTMQKPTCSQFLRLRGIQGEPYYLTIRIYPPVNIHKAIENGHRNSWFSHSKWWFSVVMLVYQRVKVFKHLDLCFGYLFNIYIYICISTLEMLNFPNTTSRPCIDESRILLTITGKKTARFFSHFMVLKKTWVFSCITDLDDRTISLYLTVNGLKHHHFPAHVCRIQFIHHPFTIHSP